MLKTDVGIEYDSNYDNLTSEWIVHLSFSPALCVFCIPYRYYSTYTLSSLLYTDLKRTSRFRHICCIFANVTLRYSPSVDSSSFSSSSPTTTSIPFFTDPAHASPLITVLNIVPNSLISPPHPFRSSSTLYISRFLPTFWASQ